VKILAFSDLHCDLEAAAQIVSAAEKADLVIGVGDFAQIHKGLEQTMEALKPINDRMVVVPGNNETLEALKNATDALILHGEVVDLDVVTLAGIGCAIPPLPPTDWGSYDMTEVDAEKMLLEMRSADILVTHSPPKGVLDMHATLGNLGSVAVRGWIKAHEPELVFCGHIHDCWGQSAEMGVSNVYNLGPTVNWFEA